MARGRGLSSLRPSTSLEPAARNGPRELYANATAARKQHSGNFVTARGNVAVNAPTLPYSEPIPTLHLVAYRWSATATCLFLPTIKENFVVKILIATASVLALVTAASAADLPQRQPAPVYSEAPAVGKMPVGKSPVGKAPYGKGPVAARY
jgi:hypothetical protein